jgi:hypothetical protein
VFHGYNNSTHEYRVNNIAPNATLNLMIGHSSKVFVANNGNVGIGTGTIATPPLSKLDVAATVSNPITGLVVGGDINFAGAMRCTYCPDLTPIAPNAPVLQVGTTNTTTNINTITNTGLGKGALPPNTTGSSNTAIGALTLSNNTSGLLNTATGTSALAANTIGSGNTATGTSALAFNTEGSSNTATGSSALVSNTMGINNTATGVGALFFNTMGGFNTAVGNLALAGNMTGGGNTAIGYGALLSNTGASNTAVGFSALVSNTTGTNNIAIGFNAATNVSTGTSNIHIGNTGMTGDDQTTRIGSAQTSFFAAGIAGTTVSNSAPVLVDTTTGQLGTVVSSRRFKEDIQDMGAATRGLMKLRPVTFRYKKPFADGSKPLQYGLIAEEVAEVYPDLIARSADGQIETVKYQVLDSMLLNEVQRQQKEIGSQQDQIQRLEELNQALQDRLARLEAALANMTAGRTVR